MKVLGNIIWLVLAGFWLFCAYVLAGIVQCIFVITIPFGVQSFKLAGYVLWPFGRAIVKDPQRDVGLSTVGNVLWFLFAGLGLAIVHLICALALAVTIIGIPFAIASLRMAGLALFPFGKRIIRAADAKGVPGAVIVG